MDRALFLRIATIAAATSTLSCVEARPRPEPVPIPAPRSGKPDPIEPSDWVDRIVEAHNSERARRGLRPLVLQSELTTAAQDHARDMANRRRMSHKGGDGSSPFDRMERQGYVFRAAAENVAYGFDDVGSVMAGWLRSPGHRRNILGNYEEIGVGRASAKDGASYWCVTFGTPRSG